MRCRIAAIIAHGAHVKEFRLVPCDGSAAPPWRAGAHVELDIHARDGSRYRNAYSLVGRPGAPGQAWRIAVQRDANGHGGSRTLHDDYLPGMEIAVSAPRQDFDLQPGAARNVLVAGGIGITPLVSMAYALDAASTGFELHYVARSRERLVLLDEFRDLAHGRVHLHATDTDGRPDLAALMGPWRTGCMLHACGPAPLLQALRAMADGLKWPPAAIRFESFGARRRDTDRPLRVVLRQSGITVDVAPGTTILDALTAAGAFVAYECRRGECGNCYAAVVAGRPLHRDVCLTPRQRAEGMTVCVSWAEGGELVLDL